MVNFFSKCVVNGYDETFLEVNKPRTLYSIKREKTIRGTESRFLDFKCPYAITNDLFICPQ